MDAHPYAALTPDLALDAIESLGHRCDGRLLALNSYENRVFLAGLEDGGALVAKFYRPGRWTDAQILEEHAFAAELAEREIPVVAPLAAADGKSLNDFGGFRFALFPKRPGRAPELDRDETLLIMGRFLGRIHAVGALVPFRHRPRLDIATFGREPLDFLLGSGLLPPDLAATYQSVARDTLARVENAWGRAGAPRFIRAHGDCHAGNVLWTSEGPHFVDLDDCRMAPAVQDLWMLLPGERGADQSALAQVLRGYREFCDFNPAELALIEPLRTLRMLHYSAWIARRWDDPAFPAAFPWFGTQRYWQDQILQLREQSAALDEPPLEMPG
jgi:Ser/Thr protein kinase RdoA (MazF antagonist)